MGRNTHAAGIFAELAEEECLKGLPEADFVERSAYYLAEINALHPFREGNGRTQRQFIRQLGHDCGHTLDWSVVTQAEMISASIFSLDSAPSKLADLIARAMGGVERPEPEASAAVERDRRASPARPREFPEEPDHGHDRD